MCSAYYLVAFYTSIFHHLIFFLFVRTLCQSLPGPGSYKLPSTLEAAGGRFNVSAAKSDVEWQMLRASQVPGPGSYEPVDPNLKQSERGGKISESKQPSHIDQGLINTAEFQ